MKLNMKRTVLTWSYGRGRSRPGILKNKDGKRKKNEGDWNGRPPRKLGKNSRRLFKSKGGENRKNTGDGWRRKRRKWVKRRKIGAKRMIWSEECSHLEVNRSEDISTSLIMKRRERKAGRMWIYMGEASLIR